MSTPSTLYITALVPSNGASTFECWALQLGFATSSQTGTTSAKTLQLGNLANASYTDIPPYFAPGLHNTPNIQYVMFLAGFAHITLPNATGSVSVFGGSSDSVLFTADIAGLSTYGHDTNYSSGEVTRLLQVPTADAAIPAHNVLYQGPCQPGINDAANTARRSQVLNGLD